MGRSVLVLLLSASLISLALALPNLPSAREFENESTRQSFPPILLDPDFGRYTVSWEVDVDQQIVTFSLAVQTLGYVGFGISKDGRMLGADIAAAEVNIDDSITFTDFYGKDDRARPTEDVQQDWTLVSASRDGTHTHLVFFRAFDTGDTEGDVVIQDEDTYFIWAISRTDNPTLDTYHGSAGNGARGAYKINILNPAVVTEPPSSSPTTEPEPTTQPATTENPAEVHPQVVLDPYGRYLMSWEVNKIGQTVTFHLEVQTLGYVGFGISKEGVMVGADIVAATVEGNGQLLINDCHGVGYQAPITDDQQDWTWLLAERNDTHTKLSFSRSFDTGDTNGDVPIEDEDTHLIWAISRSDSPDLTYHGSGANGARGAYKVNILNPAVVTTPTVMTTTEEIVTTTAPVTTGAPVTTEGTTVTIGSEATTADGGSEATTTDEGGSESETTTDGSEVTTTEETTDGGSMETTTPTPSAAPSKFSFTSCALFVVAMLSNLVHHII